MSTARVHLMCFLKIFLDLFVMFLSGENFIEIKSRYFLECANYFNDRKNIEKAIKYYDKTLNLGSKKYAYYAHRGLTAGFIEKRDYKRALEHCNKAISIDKKDAWVFVLLIIIYESLGEISLAKDTLQKTSEFFENNTAALYNSLAYAYLQSNIYIKAEYYCKEAIKMLPSEGGYHYNLAEIYLAQRKLHEAKIEFQKALELTSDKNYKKHAIRNIKSIDSKI